MQIAVIGTNEISLSTAIYLAYTDNFVVLVDDNQNKIDLLRKNSLHYYEPNLNDAIKIVSNNLYFTTNLTQAITTSDVVYFTSSEGYNLLEVSQIFAESLKEKFRILVNKSMSKIGTTEAVETMIRDKSGNFSIAFDAPYVQNGNVMTDTFYPEKIVIGSRDMIASTRLQSIYEPLMAKKIILPDFVKRPHRAHPTLVATDIVSAEVGFHAEKVFAGLKMSFVNEINNIAHKTGAKSDAVLKILRSSNSEKLQFRYGLGWSRKECGESFEILDESAKKNNIDISLINNALTSNYSQRDLLVKKIENHLRELKGKTVGILGLSYKPLTDDLTDSPAIDIIHLLIAHGACVKAMDPVCNFKMQMKFPDLNVRYCENVYDLFESVDMVVLCTDWPEFFELDWFQLSGIMNHPVIFDARNCLDPKEFASMGYELISFGGEL